MAADLGEQSVADALIDRLAPWHDRLPMGGAAVSHGVALTLGRLERLAGRPDRAEIYLLEALEVHRRVGADHFVRLTTHELGQTGEPPS